MSVVRCAHCNATGKCQCYDCAKAARGEKYAAQRYANCAVHNMLSSGPSASSSESPGSFNPFLLLLLPRAIAGSIQANDVFPCSVCSGRGYNYFGRGRFGAVR